MKYNQNIVLGLVLAATIALFAVHAFLVTQAWQIANQNRTDISNIVNFINQAGAGAPQTGQ